LGKVEINQGVFWFLGIFMFFLSQKKIEMEKNAFFVEKKTILYP